jgi:hypothetical protein
MISVTLAYGGKRAQREAAIAAYLEPSAFSIVLIEGLLMESDDSSPSAWGSSIKIVRIGPACPCCAGSLSLKVNLNRLLREKPQQLILALADSTHPEAVKSILQEAQYRQLIQLAPDLSLGR